MSSQADGNSPIQEVVTVFDFNGTVANGNTETGEDIACIGHTMCFGMIHSDANVTLIVEQGVDDSAGGFIYDYLESIPVVAGICEKAEIPIVGKFIRTRVSNASGGIANIRSFFAIRGQE